MNAMAMNALAFPSPIEASAVPELSAGLRKSRILVVDDSATIRMTISRFLRRCGFELIMEAEDGIAALEIMERTAPDLVITDLLMPRLDGLGLCRRLRSEDRWRKVPILVQTGTASTEERADAFANGATDLVSKPLNLRELFGRVRVHLEQNWLLKELSSYQESVRQDMDLAREMQEGILPTSREIRAVEEQLPVAIASSYKASLGLGGDLWGITMPGVQCLNVFMADFAGHGVAAALNTFRFQSFLRGAMLDSLPMQEAVMAMNQFLHEVLPAGQFATLLAARINFKAGWFDFASAGGPPPLLRTHGNSAFRALPSAGFPLGILEEATFDITRYPFAPGSTLLLYSDALTETPLPPQSVFDTDSLAAFASAQPQGEGPPDMIRRINGALDAHIPDDDLTMVAIRHVEAS